MPLRRSAVDGTSMLRYRLAGAYARGLVLPSGMDARLAAALDDLLSRPGSMTRALVAFRVGGALGLGEERAEEIACGMEYLHTASLVFDDLPSMDDARERRGGPCVHVRHGEGVAVLAALALVNRGYALLWNAVRMCADAERAAAAARVLEEGLGVCGLVGGQASDLRERGGRASLVEVTDVAVRKTAALVRLPVMLPALLGGADARELALLERLALVRGLAYQAADDIKDVVQRGGESGKTGGRDAELGRPNLVSVEGVAGAMARLRRLTRMGDRIERLLEQHSGRWGMLEVLRVDEPVGMERIRNSG